MRDFFVYNLNIASMIKVINSGYCLEQLLELQIRTVNP